eukprot:TRINITY_DN1450_c0_g1_i10.p1 TRINITY_DN1450_c0_g1~~TRINITY_DN1450_c0_g1_i10.p1  ORF type:complete len:1102 (+),score=238.25 TRINITY_DN1450_c0_g1_i10:61-3366(+)
MAEEYVEEYIEQGETAEEYFDDGGIEQPVEEEQQVEEAETEAAVEQVQLTGQEIVTDTFGELTLPAEQSDALAAAYALLIQAAGGRDAVGQLVYDTYYAASPALQDLFVTPKKVLSFKIFQGINAFMTGTKVPAGLRMDVESLAFRHMGWDVTVPRINIIRDAVIDRFVIELGSKLTSHAATAVVSLFNYIGGAMIYTREASKERMSLLQESWRMANDEHKNAERMASSASMEQKAGAAEGGADGSGNEAERTGQSGNEKSKKQDSAQNIPTTFSEMFLFNAAVMGFGQSLWMHELLAQLDGIVSNFHHVNRVQEECYVTTLRIAKVASGKVNLPEFKSCMLASLRSLLPKEWTTQHEMAWSWCWEKIEQMVLENMGKTARWEKALNDLLASVDEATGYQMRQDMYYRFFEVSSEGESFFKQSMSYLHLIITKVLVYCTTMYADPIQNCDEISALGLRHVGYAIPVELLLLFGGICVGVIRDLGADEVSVKAFEWSLVLVAQMMGRIITEGSTIVMKAANINSPSGIRSAIACSARGARAEWMLLITVGTRDISPFLWSVQSGSIEAALAMLNDLLTIRADRDKYYYEVDYLFRRHPDVVNTILQDAPTMLVPLLDGMIWRSRLTVDGQRRVNYYMKHLLVDPEGKFAKTLEWIVKSRDPKLMVHPLLVFLSDVIWSKIAMRSFLNRKAWFVATLLIFVISQSIIKGINHAHDKEDSTKEALRVVVFAFRVFIYLFSMGAMILDHTNRIVGSYRRRELSVLPLTSKCNLKIPLYLTHWQDAFNLLLMFVLMTMLCTEPVLWCLDDSEDAMFMDDCPGVRGGISDFYYTLNMIAMVLYYAQLMDIAVFNNRISAYVLVCGRVLAELCLFLFAMFSVLLTLSSAISCLEQSDEKFQSIPTGALALWDMLLKLFSSAGYTKLHDEPVVLLAVYIYLVIAVVFLHNVLIAQLCCSYAAIYADMVGFARLKRSRIIVDTMPSVSPKRWTAFKDSLQLDTRIEFNEGDIGIAGGMQIEEPANLNPTTTDTIRRVGGSTSPLAPWSETDEDAENDLISKVEANAKRLIDALSTKNTKKQKKGGMASSSGMSGSQGQQSGGGSAVEEEM